MDWSPRMLQTVLMVDKFNEQEARRAQKKGR